jgi:hypothetical protein
MIIQAVRELINNFHKILKVLVTIHSIKICFKVPNMNKFHRKKDAILKMMELKVMINLTIKLYNKKIKKQTGIFLAEKKFKKIDKLSNKY